jgi:methyl-accepting chemotaxis protein
MEARMKIGDLGLRSKIMFGAIPALALVIVLSALSYYTLQLLLKAIASVDQTHEVVELAQRLESTAVEMQSEMRGYLLTGDEKFLKAYQATMNGFSRMAEKLTKSVTTKAQLEALSDAEKIIEEWKTKAVQPALQIRGMVSSSELMEQLHAFVSMGLDKEYFDKFRAVTEKFIETEQFLLKQRKEEADASAGATAQILIIGTIAIVILSQVISYFMSGRISKPVIMAMDLAEATSNGDLTRELDVRTNDEVGRLGKSLNTMVNNLQMYTNRVWEGTSVLSASASEISTIAAQLSSSTAKTSSALTETTTTVEEVKQAARVSSEKAKAVAKNSVLAVEVSASGLKATEDTVERMNSIKQQMESIGATVTKLSERGEAIGEMIETVQDIAHQSHLLAVNASIEAARAGEQGKAFAVVAGEIKALADQSKSATEKVRAILEETRNGINAAVMATEQGMRAVDARVAQSRLAGESIGLLAKTVEESSQAAAVIGATVEQQFTGVDQVSTAMVNIEAAMRQNLEGTSHLEAGAQRLEGLSGALKELLKQYKV